MRRACKRCAGGGGAVHRLIIIRRKSRIRQALTIDCLRKEPPEPGRIKLCPRTRAQFGLWRETVQFEPHFLKLACKNASRLRHDDHTGVAQLVKEYLVVSLPGKGKRIHDDHRTQHRHVSVQDSPHVRKQTAETRDTRRLHHQVFRVKSARYRQHRLREIGLAGTAYAVSGRFEHVQPRILFKALGIDAGAGVFILIDDKRQARDTGHCLDEGGFSGTKPTRHEKNLHGALLSSRARGLDKRAARPVSEP